VEFISEGVDERELFRDWTKLPLPEEHAKTGAISSAPPGMIGCLTISNLLIVRNWHAFLAVQQRWW